jgi:lipopolysaccharide transport system permease protein
MRTLVIKPRRSWDRRDWLEIIEFRWVLYMLIVRDIKLRYKQTALGVIWVIFQPLMTALLLTYVFGKWLKVESDGVPYMLFSFAALIPWLVFSQSVQRAGTSLANEAHLVQKIYFPRIFLPIAGTLGVALDFVIAIATIAILFWVYQFPIPKTIFFLPVISLFLYAFSTAFNILFSALSAHYRDFKHMLPFLLQFWMYASPLAYSLSSIPNKWHWLFAINPLTGIIEVFRWSLLGHCQFPWMPFIALVFITFVFSFASLKLFRLLERTLPDVI